MARPLEPVPLDDREAAVERLAKMLFTYSQDWAEGHGYPLEFSTWDSLPDLVRDELTFVSRRLLEAT